MSSTSVRRPITVAQIKLADLIAKAGNISRFARATGGRPATVRLLLAGGSRPKADTVERYVRLGIAPNDWFEVVDDTEQDLSGRPVENEPSASPNGEVAAPSTNGESL